MGDTATSTICRDVRRVEQPVTIVAVSDVVTFSFRPRYYRGERQGPTDGRFGTSFLTTQFRPESPVPELHLGPEL